MLFRILPAVHNWLKIIYIILSTIKTSTAAFLSNVFGASCELVLNHARNLKNKQTNKTVLVGTLCQHHSKRYLKTSLTYLILQVYVLLTQDYRVNTKKILKANPRNLPQIPLISGNN